MKKRERERERPLRGAEVDATRREREEEEEEGEERRRAKKFVSFVVFLLRLKKMAISNGVDGDHAQAPEAPAWEQEADEILCTLTGRSRGKNKVLTAEEALTKGLENETVEVKRKACGWNELEKPPSKPIWKLVLEQFDDALVKILVLAALVSFALAMSEELEAIKESNHGKETDLLENLLSLMTLQSLKAFVEPGVIVLILLLNAIVGVWQESNAEKALEALQELNSAVCCCLRDGAWTSDLPARELVPGDLVKLVAGDKVPADGRMVRLNTQTIRIEQSSLTGESVPVEKLTEAIRSKGRGSGQGNDLDVTSKYNMLFAGTSVSNGSCLMVVTGTGVSTEIGKTHELIVDAQEEQEDTPLKRKLDDFGDALSKMIGFICLVVWAINYKHFLAFNLVGKNEAVVSSAEKSLLSVDVFGTDKKLAVEFDIYKCTYYFKIAVALAVAAIPEGLPAVITTCLALGTRKMAKQKAIVRKLPSVETLGCTSVICSDKTGTLTSNQMSCVEVCAAGSLESSLLQSCQVTGHSYDPLGGEVLQFRKTNASTVNKSWLCLMRIASLCNEAGIEKVLSDLGGTSSEDSHYTFRALGSPTEAAIKVLVEKLARVAEPGHESETNSESILPWSDELENNYIKHALLEFTRDRKSMSVLVSDKNSSKRKHKNELMVKGAPESVLARCSHFMNNDGSKVLLTKKMREEINAVIQGMSKKALRCLAMACKDDPRTLGPLSSYDGTEDHPAHKLLKDINGYSELESKLCFVGLAGMQDPPRPEVKDAIESCQDAGIRVVVITGDNKLTAQSICKDIGIFDSGDDDLDGKSFICADFFSDKLSDSDRLDILADKSTETKSSGLLFSRAEPKHKQDIIRLLKSERNDVIAMTGDGVNDAPALALADIGIAMGIAGTEVAKEASDMVLADDNFSTIVSAVREGRAIYNNMKAFIRYMISSNIGEVASIFITAALGLPEGLIPVQLLWVNLVTDGPPATALGFNPPDPDVMTKKPRSNQDGLITPWVLFRYLVVGFYVGFATVGIFAVWYTHSSFLGIDLSEDGHTPISFHELTHWQGCADWDAKSFKFTDYTAGDQVYKISQDGNPCDYFSATGKAKASTLSLTVLVAIEMFNAFNALSEDMSIVTVPPYVNPYLIIAAALSFALHCFILYTPSMNDIFSITPLSWNEWMLVLAFSLPVIAIDEVLKFVGRQINRREKASRGKSKID